VWAKRGRATSSDLVFNRNYPTRSPPAPGVAYGASTTAFFWLDLFPAFSFGVRLTGTRFAVGGAQPRQPRNLRGCTRCDLPRQHRELSASPRPAWPSACSHCTAGKVKRHRRDREERGDITHQHVDALVNAANSSLLGGGTRYPDGLLASQAVATTAGDLPTRWAIHTVGPVHREAHFVLFTEITLDAFRAAYSPPAMET
jgi:hypothetical protein